MHYASYLFLYAISRPLVVLLRPLYTSVSTSVPFLCTLLDYLFVGPTYLTSRVRPRSVTVSAPLTAILLMPIGKSKCSLVSVDGQLCVHFFNIQFSGVGTAAALAATLFRL